MPTAIIDGISTRYEVVGSGPPLLMYAPGGFDATLEKWSTQGIYAKIKPLDHLSKKYTCITFDRRECGQSGGRVSHKTQKSNKRKRGSTESSSSKRQAVGGDGKKKDWPTCPLCNSKHFIKEEGQCYLANPELAPPEWREKNKDRIEAFKKKGK